MRHALNVLLAGVHRGGRAIIEALPERTLSSIGTWTLVDPKPGRSDVGALRLRTRFASTRVIAQTEDALAAVRRGAAADRIIVAAVDTAQALRDLIAESTGVPVLWQVVGRTPRTSGGTCFGIAGSLAASAEERQPTLDLLDALRGMAPPASSAYLTESDVLAGPLLQTFRQVVSRWTTDRLGYLAAGAPATTEFLLALPNATLPAQIIEGRANELTARTVRRALDAHGRPTSGRCAAIAVSPDRSRIDLLSIDARAAKFVGLVEMERPASPRDAALLND